MTKLFLKFFNILFIAILLIIGISIYKDFGISIDEKINRLNGLVNLKFLFNLFSFNHFDDKLFKNIPDLNSYFDRYYGAFFEILNIILVEIVLNIKNLSEVFYTRHFLNHILFLFSLYFFYLICLEFFKNKYLSYFGVILLYTTPRIFAHSFYNSKDLAFLSFFIIAVYFSIKCFKNLNYKNSLLLALTSALAMNSRIVAIYIPFLLSFFILLDCIIKNISIKEKIKYLIIILFLSLIFFLITHPFLWEEPFKRFFELFNIFASFSGMNSYEVFYFGKFYKTPYLPWHYMFVMFFVTTPLLITIFGFIGIFFTIKRLIKRLFSINESKIYNDIWRSHKEKIILYNFFLIFIPIFSSFLFDSVIYNGWRHLYFLYPLFIIQLIYSLNIFLVYYKKKNSKKIILSLCIIVLTNNIYSLIKMHPYQHSYFNFLFEKNANKLFEIDYWGLANKDALKKILKLDPNKKTYRIASASFVDLHLSKIMLKDEENKKIEILGQNYDNAEYIFNNFYYEVNTIYDDKYKIPKEFKKIYEIRKGKILINETYKRKN